MASVAPSCKTTSSSSSPTVTTNARDRASSCSNNNGGDKGTGKTTTTTGTITSEDDSHATPYSPAPVVRSHHQLIQSPYSSQSRRHHNHHHTYHSHSYSHNRHYHLNGDSFDDSSSSLSSTPSSGCTTATATSSTSSTVSDCAIDCITGDTLAMQLDLDHHQHQHQHLHSSSSSRNTGKNSTSTAYLSHSRGQRGGQSCKSTLEQALNDLNSSPSTTGNHVKSTSSSSRKSSSGTGKKNSSQLMMEERGGGRGGGCEGSNKNGPGRRSSTPPALSNTENWSHFHFGTGAGDNSSESNESRHDFTHHNSSPRASSELYSMVATLDQRLKTATLSSSSSPKMSSSGKAVAVIKGTSSVSRLSSSSFNNGSLSGGSNCTAASSQDWKKHLHSHEIRKLKRELDQSNEKVATLTSQLATHSHMVTAFEQSLASMSLRLQQLTNLSTQKDCEIARLKAKVEELRQCNRTDARDNSLPPATPKKCKSEKKDGKNKSSNNCSKQLSEKERKSLLIRRHTFVSPVVNDLDQKDIPAAATGHTKEGKWFKAFRRSSSSNKKHSTNHGSTSDQETEEHSSSSPASGLSHFAHHRVSSVESFRQIDTPHDPDALVIHELKKQLREKEKTITDLRLEALTTAHQLQSLEELVGQLKGEIASYKAENEKLNKLSTGSSGSSMTSIRLSSQNSPLKPNEPSIVGSEWQNSDEASGYASINSLYFNPYDTC